ncbi:MAG: TrbI/VirB10 family protein [Vicinamibacterales bacterium]
MKDLRVPPRGVIPRGTQTWLLAGVAVFMLVIMLVVGRPAAPTPQAAPQGAVPGPAQSTDRVREYQERLRLAEAQALAQAQAFNQPVAPDANADGEPAPQAVDPVQTERRRRDYESLFASNVVLSRRPEAERPDVGRPAPVRAAATGELDPPSLDDIVDAATRATARATAEASAEPRPPDNQSVAPPGPAVPEAGDSRATPEVTGPINSSGPNHRLLEGTVIDTILTNRLDGDGAAPVNCLVTNPVYSHTGSHVVIPAGARVLGETRPVQSFGERRLAVAFHRLVLPDGRTHRLDQFLGLNQRGDAGLRDRVNQHYLATFGAAAAVGLVSGLSQYLGSAGLGRGGQGDRTVVIAGGVGDATAQATLQVMNRFLNRLPTITIREGHRVKVYLTNDIDLPEYVSPRQRLANRP